MSIPWHVSKYLTEITHVRNFFLTENDCGGGGGGDHRGGDHRGGDRCGAGSSIHPELNLPPPPTPPEASDFESRHDRYRDCVNYDDDDDDHRDHHGRDHHGGHRKRKPERRKSRMAKPPLERRGPM